MNKAKQKELENQIGKLSAVCLDKDRLIENLKDRNIQLVTKLNYAVSNITGVLNDLVK